MFLLSVIVILLSLFTFYQTFSLNLFGDDWLAFFRYFQHLGPESPGSWNHLTYYLTPYGAQDILMGIMQKIFGFESSWYYLTSYLFRILAAFSFYPLVFYLTKSKIAAFFSVLFFAVTVTGFDTTNWVFNMPTYITIALFNLFILFFLKAREDQKFSALITAGILYYLAYITTPIRMHGSLPFIFLLELFWLFQERNIKTLKKIALRLTLIIGVFLIIRYTGHSQGPAQEVTERFGLGIKAMSEMLTVGRFDFIFYPLVMFGNLIFPDFILSPFQIPTATKLLKSALIPYLGFLIITALLLKDIHSSGSKIFKYITVGISIWVVIVLLVLQNNLVTFNNSRYVLALLIGGFSMIFIFALLLKFINQKGVSKALFLAFSWSILSFFFAWWWVPASIFPTTYRYLIVSAAGIAILLGTVISLGKERKNRVALFATFSIILILHIFATHTYLNFLSITHGKESVKKIWSSVPYVSEIGKSKEPIIFYFEGDGTNGGVLHDAITFGFPPRMAILYNLREEDGGLPVPMDDIRQVVSAVTDGKALAAFGYPIKPINPDRVYAFHLQGNETLINITNELRAKLKELNGNQTP